MLSAQDASSFRYKKGEVIKSLKSVGAQISNVLSLSEKIKIVAKSSVGKNKEHLQLKLMHTQQLWDAIQFNSNYHDLRVDEYVDIVFSLEHNNFRGQKKLQLQIKDLKRSKN